MSKLKKTDDKQNKIIINKDKFVGQIKVRNDGRVEVVTELSDGNESIKLATWQEIKKAVDEKMLNKR